MPFLAAPAVLGGLISAGGGIASTLLANKAAGAGLPNPQEQAALNQTSQIQKTTADAGTGLLTQGQQTLQQPINYWSSILSGNRGAITSQLAPELFQIGQGYHTAANTSAALNPRGGPSASFLSQLPFQQQRDVSTLFQQARPQAASTLAGTGGGLLSAGANTLAASTAAGRDILSQSQNIRAQQAANSRSLGAGLFDLIQKYGPGIISHLPGMGSPGNNIPGQLPQPGQPGYQYPNIPPNIFSGVPIPSDTGLFNPNPNTGNG